jgi:hypothetical protein
MIQGQVKEHREEVLAALDQAVADAAAFLSTVDETLADGEQTAREVLSHLVFWHREYAAIINALAQGDLPRLRAGRYREMHDEAAQEFASQSLPVLAWRLLGYQADLAAALYCLPDWSIDFPLKQGSSFQSVAERLPQIESHIRNHIVRLRRAQRRGHNGYNDG